MDAIGKFLSDGESSPIPPSPSMVAPSKDVMGEFLSSQPPSEPVPSDGTHPDKAIPMSPGSLMERAVAGWYRKPEEQENFLRGQYQDVKRINTGPDSFTFAVKDKDGKWYDFNPNFHWNFSIPGAVTGAIGGLPGGVAGAVVLGVAGGVVLPTLADAGNLKSLAGSAAEATGEYGLRSMAATTTGLAAYNNPISQSIGAMGPLGKVAQLGIGAVGAGLGAMGAEAIDLGARQGISPESQPYQSPKEIQAEMTASMMFGAEQFLGGKALEFAGGKIANTFGKIIEGYTKNPGGNETVRSLLGMMGATPQDISDRLQNPLRTAHYDNLMSEDLKNPITTGLGRLDRVQNKATDDILSGMQGIMRKESKEFGELINSPGAKQSRVDLNDLIIKAKDALMNQGILQENGKLNPKFSLGDGDMKALKVIQGLDGDVSFRDARTVLNSISSVLDNGVQNKFLQKVLVGIKEDTHGAIIEALPEGLGQKYAQMVTKYGPIRSALSELTNVMDTNKRFTLAQKLGADGMNSAKDLAQQLVDAGLDQDLLYNFRQIQVARNSANWFNPSRTLKGIPAPGNKVGAKIITGAANVSQGIQNDQIVQSVLPYLDKLGRVARKVAPKDLQQVLMSPQALQTLSGIIQGSAMQEKQTKDQLLQSAGVSNE